MFSSLTVSQDLLQRSRRAFRQRKGACFGLWGEPGIGKTHAINNFIRELAVSSLTIHAKISSSVLLQRLPDAKPNLATWVMNALETARFGKYLESEALIAALGAYFAALTPFVLHVEDLHEAAQGQLAFWNDLAQVIRRTAGVVMIVSSRNLPTSVFDAIHLEHFNLEQSNGLLETEIGGQLPQRAKTWVFEHAQGNPLFTLEFFRHVTRQGFLWSDGLRWRWREPSEKLVPETLEALIERLLIEAYKIEDAKVVLAARAVLGLEMKLPLWAAVAKLELERLEQIQETLNRNGILQGSSFVHPLFQEVVQSQSTASQGQLLAQRAFNALKDSDPIAAANFIEQANLEPSIVLELLNTATSMARDQNNSILVGRLLARTARVAVGEAQFVAALEAAEKLFDTDILEAKALAELAVGSQPQNSDAVFMYTKLLIRQGHIEQAQHLFSSLPEHAREEVRWWLYLIQLRIKARDYPGVIEIWQTHPEIISSADSVVLAGVIRSLGNCNQLDTARSLIDYAFDLAMLSKLDWVRFLNARGAFLIHTGGFVAAERDLQTALALASDCGVSEMLPVVLNLSGLHQHTDQYLAAVKDLEKVLELTSQIGDGQGYAECLCRLGSVQTDLGEYQRAEETLLESRRILERSTPGQWLALCESHLAVLYMIWLPSHGAMLALKHAQAGLAYVRVLGDRIAMLDRLFFAIKAEATHGNPQHALELAEEMLELSRQGVRQGLSFFPIWAHAKALFAVNKVNAARNAFVEAIALAKTEKEEIAVQAIELELDHLEGNVERARQRIDFFTSRNIPYLVTVAQNLFPQFASVQAQALETPWNVQILGSLRLEYQGQAKVVQGIKRKAFVALLTEARVAGRHGVRQIDLLDALYPDTPEPSAVTSLHQLVFQIRSSFGEQLIQTMSDGYALGEASIDAVQFLETGNTHLWRGVYLEDAGVETNPQVLEALKTKLRESARTQLESDPLETLRVSQILLEMDTYDLVALELALRALQKRKQYTSIKRLYTRASNALQEVGEVLPKEWTVFLERGLVQKNL